MLTKNCGKCNLEKPKNAFHKDKTTKDGFYPHCKVCKALSNKKRWHSNKSLRMYHNNKRLLRLYGIDQKQYNAILLMQNQKCAICSIHQSTLKKAFDVDHCHTTKVVRGLLCGKCNKFLGHYERYLDAGVIPVFSSYLNTILSVQCSST